MPRFSMIERPNNAANKRVRTLSVLRKDSKRRRIAAVKIQTIVRGFVQRRKYARSLEEKNMIRRMSAGQSRKKAIAGNPNDTPKKRRSFKPFITLSPTSTKPKARSLRSCSPGKQMTREGDSKTLTEQLRIIKTIKQTERGRVSSAASSVRSKAPVLKNGMYTFRNETAPTRQSQLVKVDSVPNMQRKKASNDLQLTKAVSWRASPVEVETKTLSEVEKRQFGQLSDEVVTDRKKTLKVKVKRGAVDESTVKSKNLAQQPESKDLGQVLDGRKQNEEHRKMLKSLQQDNFQLNESNHKLLLSLSQYKAKFAKACAALKERDMMYCYEKEMRRQIEEALYDIASLLDIGCSKSELKQLVSSKVGGYQRAMKKGAAQIPDLTESESSGSSASHPSLW
jgi:hypothetical protein